MSLPKYIPHTSALTMLVGDRFSQAEYDALEQALVMAIHAGTLDVADVQVRDDSRQLPAIEGWRSLGNDIGKLNGVRIWMSNQGAVRYILKPEPFREWLQRTGRPLPDGCELAAWCGAEAKAESVAKEESQGKREREINRYLRETWNENGSPGGAQFFRLLKQYKGVKGSPITEFWDAGKGKGIEYKTSGGGGGTMTAKWIQNMVSEWKRSVKNESR